MSEIDSLMAVAKSFRTGMLVTHDPGGELRARPLSVAACDEDGQFWFVTSRASGKADEVRRDERAAIVFQGKLRYASLTARCEIVEDDAKKRELFRAWWKPWFPGGPNDPESVLLRANVEGGEYWDLHGIRGIRYVLHALGALVRRRPASDRDTDTDGFHGAVVPPSARADREGARATGIE